MQKMGQGAGKVTDILQERGGGPPILTFWEVREGEVRRLPIGFATR